MILLMVLNYFMFPLSWNAIALQGLVEDSFPLPASSDFSRGYICYQHYSSGAKVDWDVEIVEFLPRGECAGDSGDCAARDEWLIKWKLECKGRGDCNWDV
jgi:hypothetical protein